MVEVLLLSTDGVNLDVTVPGVTGGTLAVRVLPRKR